MDTGAALQGGILNIVMEYGSGGDVAAAIQRRQLEKKPFSEDEIMFWWAGRKGRENEGMVGGQPPVVTSLTGPMIGRVDS